MKQLALDAVTVNYGKVQALRGVGLEAKAGEVLMLVGPNGAGKSTLIKVLLGLVRPDSGKLTLDGKPHAVDNGFKRQLGYLPEDAAFAPNLTGRQVLRFFARARGVPNSRVDAVLKQVGLTHAGRRPVRGYSRGMRQRLGLGVAIVGEPQLLVLDEPTGGLDQEGLKVLWSVLEECQTRGRLVIMASHDLALMERRIDHICLLKDGQACASGTAEQLRSQARVPVRVGFTLGHDKEAVEQFIARLEKARGENSIETADGVASLDVEPDELMATVDLKNEFPGAVSGVRVTEAGLDVVCERLLEGDD